MIRSLLRRFRDRTSGSLTVEAVFVLPMMMLGLIGFFANPEFFDGAFEEGIFYGGDAGLLLEQALANGAAIVWSFVVTFAIVFALKKTIGVRVDEQDEANGLDNALHAESAYH